MSTLPAAPPFLSPYAHDFVRLAACVPQVRVADSRFNTDQTLDLLSQADRERVAVMVFPELGLSA